MKGRVGALSPLEKLRMRRAAARGAIAGIIVTRAILGCGLDDAQKALYALSLEAFGREE
jgi:hypothetical protein